MYNYLAFKFFVRRKVPVRINGDDILFRATPAEYERWRDGIGELGLKLSAGKTFVHPRYMSVNSTYFWSHQKRVERLSVLRLGMLKSPESPMSLGNSHNDFVRPMKGAVRRRSSVLFLRTHKRLFKSSGRSLLLSSPWGLGMRVGVEALGLSGLFERECFYLENIRPRKPVPSAPSVHNLSGVPDGWIKSKAKPRRWKSLEEDFMESMVNMKWGTRLKTEDADWDSFWEKVKTYGGEGFWTSFVAYRRSGGYAKGFDLLRKHGFSKSNHPLRLRSSFVHEAIQQSRRCPKASWWVRKTKLRFVRAQQQV
jgi:hypothetical protein